MKKSILIFFMLSLLWLPACNKKSSELDYNPNVLTSKDYLRGEDAILEILDAFFKGIYDTLVMNTGYAYIDACEVSYHPDENSMSFSYGDVNRYCLDNKFRRNRFNAVFTGPIFEEGVVANIKTDSLFVDDLLNEATIEIRSLGMNGNNLPEYSLKVKSSMIMLPDTSYTSGVSIITDFTMVWAEGSDTPEIHEDDLYTITGSATGISAGGLDFSVDIQEPLYDYLDCFWVSQGIGQITVPSAHYKTGTIDYLIEDGCNNEMYFYFNENLFYDFLK